MRKSIYLLTTTPTSHIHRFHPHPPPANHTHRLYPLPLATPIHYTHSTIGIHTFNFAQVQSMDDNCGEWVECMGLASGCGCKEVYIFPHITYPYSSRFCSIIPTFCSFFMFYIILYVYILPIEPSLQPAPLYWWWLGRWWEKGMRRLVFSLLLRSWMLRSLAHAQFVSVGGFHPHWPRKRGADVRLPSLTAFKGARN